MRDFFQNSSASVLLGHRGSRREADSSTEEGSTSAELTWRSGKLSFLPKGKAMQKEASMYYLGGRCFGILKSTKEENVSKEKKEKRVLCSTTNAQKGVKKTAAQGMKDFNDGTQKTQTAGRKKLAPPKGDPIFYEESSIFRTKGGE